MGKFLQTLPPRIKVGLHFFQLLLGLYYTTALTMINTPLGSYLIKYLGVVSLTYLGLFPLVHTILEVAFGVPGTSPGEMKRAGGVPLMNKPPEPPRSKFGRSTDAEIMPTKKLTDNGGQS